MGGGTLEELATQAEKLYLVAGLPSPRHRDRIEGFLVKVSPGLGGERQYAISSLLARIARRDSAVQAFREKRLGNKLLAFDEVEDWIKRTADSEQPPTTYLRFPLEDRDFKIKAGRIMVEPPVSKSEFGPGAQLSSDPLKYATHTSDFELSIPTRFGGVLYELARLSQSLAKRYGWQEGQATVFVLVDLPPLVRTLSVITSLKMPIGVLSRIELTVDPTLSPKVVAEQFKKARDKLLGQRPRSLSSKHIQLVMFCDERPPGETWAVRMAAWNQQHSKWKYEAVKNFLRDANQGLRRLLGPNAQYDRPQKELE